MKKIRLIDVKILEDMQGDVEEIVSLLNLLRNVSTSTDARDVMTVNLGLGAVRSLVERLGDNMNNAISTVYCD